MREMKIYGQELCTYIYNLGSYFGTFKEEEEEPEYGITSGFDRANAYNATFSYWKNLLQG